MWCRHCQQDVPAVAQGALNGVQCARCQKPLDQPTNPSAPKPDAVVFEPWKLSDVLGDDQQRLHKLGQQLRSAQATASMTKPAARSFRRDLPHTRGGAPAVSSVSALNGVSAVSGSSAQTGAPATASTNAQRTPNEYRPPAVREPSKPNQIAGWVTSTLGALVLGAGLGLLGWSLFGERPDLWDPAVAATLSGQGLMIVGLIQLLANLWTGSRDATNRLIALQYEMRRLQRTTDAVAGMRSAAPTNFYADLARGSSPQVMLANLKGQVEELTTRLAAE